MNRNRYRTIFSKRLGMLVPVAEAAKANGKGSGVAAESGSNAAPPLTGSGVPVRLKTVSLLILAVTALWHGVTQADPLPTGGVVTGGTGTINQNGSTLTVNQSSQYLSADWQSFNIGANHTVAFNQPNSASVALNRIIGTEASSIYGNLLANGQVFLINPNGILFAPGSQVNVGGLAASTLNLSEADFAAGRYRFTHGAGAGSVVNEGQINAGSVVFIGPQIINNGTISTPGGRTTFAAGDQVTVSMLDGLLSAQVDVSALDAEIQNHGSILADGGRVDLLAGRADTVLNSLINTDGVIQARSLREDGGRIFLDGGAGGTVNVSGVLDARAPSSDQGGEVRVLGDRITLADGARIDASGQNVGGTVLIGGDFQGKNAAILNASSTTVEQGAEIRADGTGQGGRVIIWSNDATRFSGDIYARGKGFAEVSGKGTLNFSGNVDTGGGTLLLDPTDITVQGTAGDGTNTFSGTQIATLLTSNDVVLNADNNITWNSGVTLDYNGVGTRSLTLQAGNDITYRGIIRDSVAGGDKLSVTLNADRDANGTGGIIIPAGASITTSGGDIVLRGGNAALTALPAFTDAGYESALSSTAARRISIGLATLDAGGGNITLRGEGASSAAAVGILLNNARIRTIGSGSITIDGLGASTSTGGGYGVQLTNSSPTISTVDGTLSVQGIGRGTGTENSGVRLNNGTIEATGSGNLILNGLGSTGGDFNDGIVVDASTLRVLNGNMTIAGTGRGTGAGSDGIELANSALVEATGSGNISFNGTSTATGASTNRGVTVWLSSTVRTTSGTLTLQGSSADPTKGNAISLDASGTIGGASQTGAVTLTGDTINLASGQILGTGGLLLQPLTPTTTIGLGDGATGTFNLTSSEIALITNGFSSITIGRNDSSGAVDVRTAAFLDPVTIRTPAGSGSIAVNGTLSTGTGTSLGSITLQAGGNVSLNNGTIDTSDALSITGGSYTATGASTLKSNTLAFGNTNGITNTGTLTFNQTADTTLANVIGGSGNLVKAGANTLTMTGNSTYSGGTTVNAGTLRIDGSGSLGSLSSGTHTYSANIINNGTLQYSSSANQQFSGVISGTGNLIKDTSADSTLTLTAFNTFTGAATVNAGTVSTQAPNGGTGALGTASSITINNGGTVRVGGDNSLLGGPASSTTITINSGGTLVNDTGAAVHLAHVVLDGGTMSATTPRGTWGNWLFNDGVSTGGSGATSYISGGNAALTQAGGTVFNVQAGDTLNVSTALDVGSADLVKQGAGTLVLTGNNSYTGGTTISGGTLQVGSNGTTGTLGTGNVVNNSLLFFNRSNDITVANTISGTGSVLKAGAGILTLSGNNTYSGGTTIRSGALHTNTSTAAGTGTVTLGDSGTGTSNVAWRIRGGTAPLNNIVVSSNGTGTATLGGYSAGTFTEYHGTVQLDRDVIIQDDTNDRTTFDGAVSGTGNISISGRRVTFGNDATTATGVITVNAGSMLQNNTNLALRSHASIINNGTFMINATNPVIQSYNGTGTTQAITGGTKTLTVGYNDASGNYSGVIQNGAAAVNFSKIGTGTQILTGNNAYSGTTTISGGTLQVGNNGTTGRLGTGAVTNNANLVFNRSDTVSLSTLASNAAGITGLGNVTGLIGGGFNVDRGIALTGANSTILLEAGKNQPAGTTTGGDVTLTSNISTSATGTVTIFSGNATTAAYEAKISGATGATRYKTYDADAADTSGAVSGTRNYYYRSGAGTVSVTGLSASKTYDGLVDASGALNTGAAVVGASSDGDILSMADLTPVAASFDSAHAGTRSLNASFTAASNTSYSNAGTNWSVSGLSTANVTGTGSGTITPKQVTVGINGVGKTYDGLTSTMSTLGSPSGFIGGDSATGVSGLQLAFDNPNAGTRNIVASGTGSITDFKGSARGNGSGIGAGNEVAGLASDYTVATPTPVSAVISPAALTVQANNDAKIVTQADTAGYNGVSFSGFVNGESAADLGGALSITRSNAGTEAAGNYTGVLVPTGYTSGNYTITYANGDFRILPAQQLLVRIQNVSNAYGTSAGYTVTSAQYLDANGSTLRTLTQTAQNGNTYTYTDGAGGSVTFTVTPQGAIVSGAGQLAAGNYTLAGGNVNITGNNFTGLNYVGNQTVNRAALTPQASGVSKVYDGTTAMNGLTLDMTGLLAGDVVNASGSGAFSSRNAGTNRSYVINGLALSGADAGNYYLTAGSLSGNNGVITPRQMTVTAVPATKVYDGTRSASGIPTVTGLLATGDNFALFAQEFLTANVGTNLTLRPLVEIDDGNGGANYALTLINNTSGVISSGVDVTQLGGTHAASILNNDNGEGQSDNVTDTDITVRCGQGVYQDGCGEFGGAVYRIIATGLKLPQGLTQPLEVESIYQR